jgi:hypothetical protein
MSPGLFGTLIVRSLKSCEAEGKGSVETCTEAFGASASTARAWDACREYLLFSASSRAGGGQAKITNPNPINCNFPPFPALRPQKADQGYILLISLRMKYRNVE